MLKLLASRLGKKSESTIRPLTLSSSTVVQQILRKSGNLGKTEKFKNVYLSPDRTPEERAKHKVLVLELKRRAEAEDKKFFIRKGNICSFERQN